MLFPQTRCETMHQKSRDILDVGEVTLDFSGTLDFPQGLLLTAFYLLQESVWFGAWISRFRFFFPSSLLWSSYYSSLYKDRTERIEHSPSGFSGVWPYYRADNLPRAGQVLQWYCSIHVCFLPSFVCAVPSASEAPSYLANLIDFKLSFWSLHSHLCETYPDVPLPILPSFCSFRHAFIDPAYWVYTTCPVNKINVVLIMAKLTSGGN